MNKLKEATLNELHKIILHNYGVDLDKGDLESFAYNLLGYYGLLLKIENRDIVRESSYHPD